MAGGSGSGGSATTTVLPTEELNDLIEQASRFFDLACGAAPEYFEPALYPVWESNHEYVVGETVTPTTPNSHIYRVTTAGITGASEPVFPTGSGATVASGTVVFTEHGADVVASERTIYGDGTHYLKLNPYVPGSLDTDITLPDGYTVPDFIERDGYLVITSSDGVAPPFPHFTSHYWAGWWAGVPVTISAIWGYQATPADVKMAVIELVINLHRETDPATVKLKGLEGQALREKMPPRVAEVARRYRPKIGAAFV